jgi:hypothetical protein
MAEATISLKNNPLLLAFLMFVTIVIALAIMGIIAQAIETAMNTSEITGFTDGLITGIEHSKGKDHE